MVVALLTALFVLGQSVYTIVHSCVYASKTKTTKNVKKERLYYALAYQ